MEGMLNSSVDCEIEYSRLLDVSQEEQDKLDDYQADLEAARDRFNIALSSESTTEDIHLLETDVSKGTVLEVVLIKMRANTTNYVRIARDTNKSLIDKTNKELKEAENLGDLIKGQEIRLKIGKIEETISLTE